MERQERPRRPAFARRLDRRHRRDAGVDPDHVTAGDRHTQHTGRQQDAVLRRRSEAVFGGRSQSERWPAGWLDTVTHSHAR